MIALSYLVKNKGKLLVQKCERLRQMDVKWMNREMFRDKPEIDLFALRLLKQFKKYLY